MIDYFLKFASRNAAKTDPDVVEHFDQLSDLFDQGMVIPNVQFWRASQDVSGTDPEGSPTVTHTYLPGFYLCIALPRIAPRLVNHSATQLVLDRDLANQRNRDAIIKSNVSIPILKDLRWSPVFCGADYPWGFDSV